MLLLLLPPPLLLLLLLLLLPPPPPPLLLLLLLLLPPATEGLQGETMAAASEGVTLLLSAGAGYAFGYYGALRVMCDV
jgi:hypothetical protein